jgi:hypothetical protein
MIANDRTYYDAWTGAADLGKRSPGKTVTLTHKT